MKLNNLLTVSGLIASSVCALDNNSQYVKLSINKAVRSNSLLKRDDEDFSQVDLANQGDFYSVTFKVGTPPQEVTVQLDTGSSDLWLIGSGESVCQAKLRGHRGHANRSCSTYGTFDSNKSSTFHSNDTSFSLSYADTDVVYGTWGMDVLAMNDVNVTGLSFGVANFTNSTMGILGVGYPALESTVVSGTSNNNTGSYEYQNLPLIMKQNGLIQHTAYSLFLNDQAAKSGTILFGAVDHSRYVGTLYTVPLVNVDSAQGWTQPTEFDITLYGMGLQTDSKNVTLATTKIPVLLDSGSTLMYLPPQMVEIIGNYLGGEYDNNTQYYYIDCPSDDNDTQVVFDFGGFHINAPLTNLVDPQNDGSCQLLISPSTDGATFGDVFLQYAYVVYDLENYEISIAQAVSGTEKLPKEDIEVIGDTVPSAVRAPSYNNPWVNGTNISSGGNIFTIAATNSSSTTRSVNSTSTSTMSGNQTSGSTTSTDSENVANIAISIPSFTSFLFLSIMSLLL